MASATQIAALGAVMDELVRPNWHIAMVHFPIAFMVVGAAVELFSFLGWRRSGFRGFGRWAFLLGAIVAVPTTFGGLYALKDVVEGGLPTLRETDPAAAETILDHLWQSAAATAGAMLIVVTWIAFNDAWRDRLSLVFKLLLALVAALVIVAAHHGGDIVYAHKIGPHGQGPSTLPTTVPNQSISDLAEAALRLEQLHVYIAGLAAAMACVSIGWSIRVISQPDDPIDYNDAVNAQRIAAAFSANGPAIADTQMLASSSVLDSTNHTPPVRTGRLWMLTLLLMLAASASGLWYLAQSWDAWDIESLRDVIRTPIEDGDPDLTRRYAHTIVGLVLVGQTLLLAMASVVARRNKWLLVLLALPLLLALAAQVWLGLLLLVEGPAGKVTEFTAFPW
jgi:uncharacterized membrane protein